MLERIDDNVIPKIFDTFVDHVGYQEFLDEQYPEFKNIFLNELGNYIDEIEHNIELEIHTKIRTELEKEYEDEFIKGVQKGIEFSKICPYCHTKIIESVHHILPRANGGESISENIIALCNKCHDEIEILTDDLLKNRRQYHYSINDLKEFIFNKSFPNEDKENLIIRF